jgi:hypothetical protein
VIARAMTPLAVKTLSRSVTRMAPRHELIPPTSVAREIICSCSQAGRARSFIAIASTAYRGS